MKLMKLLLIIAHSLFFMFMAGCKPMTVLEKLQSEQRYDELNNAFWVKEFKQHSPIWQEATAYCSEHTEKINCGPVMLVSILSHGSRVVPAYGSSGQYLTLPEFN